MTTRPLEGVRVIEMAMYAFGPSCGAILSDWGAEVVKVSHPTLVDPMRGIPVQGLPSREDDLSFMWEQLNRGKRSMTLDVANPDGRKVLDDMLRTTDVFLTNLLPEARARLRLDVDDIRSVNPRIVYARATGQGVRGPDRSLGAFDHTAFWCRSGIGHAASLAADEFQTLLGPAFGDLASGMALAGGVAAALVQLERSGEAPVVDGSLLATGMWMLSPAIVASVMHDVETLPRPRHADSGYALVAGYETSDGRVIFVAGVRTDRHWESLCECLGSPGLLEDSRFATTQLRFDHSAELVAELDRVFGSRTLSDWRPRLRGMLTPWSVVNTAREVYDDPQVEANRYLVNIQAGGREEISVVAAPIQFDEHSPELRSAPEPGADTETILLELDLSWDEINQLRDDGAI
jgi:crotonobetainyl-CoA:carnitine CoA-transferase CaiB-like acyl-CoA transferase